MFTDEGQNTTDVEGSLKQVQDNDAKLKELNLNNIKVTVECPPLQSWSAHADLIPRTSFVRMLLLHQCLHMLYFFDIGFIYFVCL